MTYDDLTEDDKIQLRTLVLAMASPTLLSGTEGELLESARNGNVAAQHSCDRKGISWKSELVLV